MKWALAQLYRYNGKPFEFEEEIDLSSRLPEGGDILKISPVKVKGVGKQIQDDHYIFYLHIECVCTIPCAVTLEEIDYIVSLDEEEEFDTVDSGDEVTVISGQTIDLTDAIWDDIYLSIPMRVVKAEYEAQQN